MKPCVSSYYFYSNRIAIRWRAGAQLTLRTLCITPCGL